MSGIAAQYGFRDYKLSWDDPNNADLKKQRDDPHVLNPGDVVYIPDKGKRVENRPTGKTHVFQVSDKKLMLRIALHDFDNLPMEGVECELEVDGKEQDPFRTATALSKRRSPRTWNRASCAYPAWIWKCR